MLRFLFGAALMVLLFSGCLPSPCYQKTVSITGNKWSSDYLPNFVIDIEDTTVAYNMYFVIRHTNAYAYSNIWMWIYTKKPGDTTFTKTRIEVPLSDAAGHWFGKGMGEIWEQRMPISHTDDPNILRQKGRYEIRLQQNMRDPVLAEVLQVGLRIEKGSKRNTLQNK
jgi:gliding motility-associated lipoprotein GldH